MGGIAGCIHPKWASTGAREAPVTCALGSLPVVQAGTCAARKWFPCTPSRHTLREDAPKRGEMAVNLH